MRLPFVARDWRTGALALSVLANLFMLGWEASHFFHRRPPPDPAVMISDVVDRLAGRLDPADADVLRGVYAARRGELPPPGGNDPQLVMRRVRAALNAEPFDPAALDAALRQGEQQHRSFEEAVRAIAVEAATRMSAKGRHTVAEFGPPDRP